MFKLTKGFFKSIISSEFLIEAFDFDLLFYYF